MVKYAVGNYNPADPEVVDLKSFMYFNSLFQAEMYYIDNYIMRFDNSKICKAIFTICNNRIVNADYYNFKRTSLDINIYK